MRISAHANVGVQEKRATACSQKPRGGYVCQQFKNAICARAIAPLVRSRPPIDKADALRLRAISDYQHIRYAVADGILTITLHRPDQLNAFTSLMAQELIDASIAPIATMRSSA